MYLVFRSVSPDTFPSHVIGLEVMATLPKFVTTYTDTCYLNVDEIELPAYGVKTKNELIQLFQKNVNHIILNKMVSGITEIAFSNISLETSDDPVWNDVAIPAWQRLVNISHMTTL